MSLNKIPNLCINSATRINAVQYLDITNESDLQFNSEYVRYDNANHTIEFIPLTTGVYDIHYTYKGNQESFKLIYKHKPSELFLYLMFNTNPVFTTIYLAIAIVIVYMFVRLFCLK